MAPKYDNKGQSSLSFTARSQAKPSYLSCNLKRNNSEEKRVKFIVYDNNKSLTIIYANLLCDCLSIENKKVPQ
jgi:hypothetical protein